MFYILLPSYNRNAWIDLAEYVYINKRNTLQWTIFDLPQSEIALLWAA